MGITINSICPGLVLTDVISREGPKTAEGMGLTYEGLIDLFASESAIKRPNTVEEVAAVGRAEGVALAPDAVDTVMKAADALPPTAYSSLHHDLVDGKPLELEAFHGHLLRLGRRHGVRTPMADAVYAALLPHAVGSRA